VNFFDKPIIAAYTTIIPRRTRGGKEGNCAEVWPNWGKNRTKKRDYVRNMGEMRTGGHARNMQNSRRDRTYVCNEKGPDFEEFLGFFSEICGKKLLQFMPIAFILKARWGKVE
jgi:hypothetical protein